MIVRALDAEDDWTFGAGRNCYKRNLDAVTQNIQTRLMMFLGDCFFNVSAGIDWFNLLGSSNQLGLNIAVSTTILNTEFVTGIKQLSLNIDAVTRAVTMQYRAQTSLGEASDTFQYDANGLV